MKLIRIIIAGILLAVMLKNGLPIKGLWAVLTFIFALIFLNVVRKNIGEDGIKNAWGWTKKAGEISIGIAIFLILLLLGSILEELLAPNRPEKLSLAWNAIVLLFSCGLAVASVTGNRWWIGIMLTIALSVLTVQLGFPTYAKTWPNEKTVSTNYLKKYGIILGPALLLWHGAVGMPEPTPPPPTNPPPIIVEFPISGEGNATDKVGVKIWFDPQKTRVRTSRPARYVFLRDNTLVYEDTEGTSEIDNQKKKEWLSLIPGEYLVYPLKGDKVYVKWQ